MQCAAVEVGGETKTCVAAEIPRAEAGCVLHLECGAHTANPRQDLHWRRMMDEPRLTEETEAALRSNLQILSFAPVRIVGPSPATHAISTKWKAGECIRHCIWTQKVS